MSVQSDLKDQRDKFLAFSFAGADILIEINEDGKIIFAMGAIKSLVDADENEIREKFLSDIFEAQDKTFIKSIQDSKKFASKQGPYLAKIASLKDPTKTKRVFVSSFKMLPDSPMCIAITVADELLSAIGYISPEAEKPKISTPDQFEEILRRKITTQTASQKNTNVQMVELQNIDSYKGKLGQDNWDNFLSSIGQALMDNSLDGDSAVKIDNGKYMLLKDADGNDQSLESILSSVAQDFNLGDSIGFDEKTMVADPLGLTAKETTRAILYTLKKIEKGGLESTNDNLKESFGTYLKENTNKISQLKRIVSYQEFAIHFQPIVDLKTEDISHHEVLIRLDKVNSPYEMMVLGEEFGISPDIDLAVCRQSMKYVDMNKKINVGKLAVNISGYSIQNDQFAGKLVSLLKEYPAAASHIIFELTESSEIKELDKVDKFIQELRGAGYPVCLDDFGAGAASFQYLQKLHIDGIKIDGSYIKTMLTSPRDATMVKNITKMCHEMDVYVVAEMIETREQATFLRDIGVDKGQGWLFSKAMPEVQQSVKKIA